MKLDLSGAVWLAGTASSRAVPGAARVSEYGPAGAQDYFIARVTAAGRLMWLAFVGGSGEELSGPSLQVDAGCFATIAGATESVDFPVTPGAFGPRQAGLRDAVVCRLGPDGSRLEYATYLGGSGSDNGPSTALGPDGSITLAGSTESGDFPVTLPGRPGHVNTQADVYAVRLDIRGHVVYSCILSGETDDGDRSDGLAVAPDGSAYIVGHTWSADFPAVRFGGRLGGFCDGFIVRLDGAGRLIGGRFLGGENGDMVFRVGLDASGSPTVLGGTCSVDLPVSAGAFQPRFGGGGSRTAALLLGDLFVCRLTPDLRATESMTYLGGPLVDEAGTAMDLDIMADGRILVLVQSVGAGVRTTQPGQGPRGSVVGRPTLVALLDRYCRAECVTYLPTPASLRLVQDLAAQSGHVSLLRPVGEPTQGMPLTLRRRGATQPVLQVRELVVPSLRRAEPHMPGLITPVTRQFALLATSAPPPGTALPNTRLRLRVALCRMSGP
jgi:hypothetical protein